MKKLLVVLAVVIAAVMGSAVTAIAVAPTGRPYVTSVRGNIHDGFVIRHDSGAPRVAPGIEQALQNCSHPLLGAPERLNRDTPREQYRCRVETREQYRWLRDMRRALNHAG